MSVNLSLWPRRRARVGICNSYWYLDKFLSEIRKSLIVFAVLVRTHIKSEVNFLLLLRGGGAEGIVPERLIITGNV